MRLSDQDYRLFFKLYPALLCFVSQRADSVEPVATPAAFARLPLREKIAIRRALCDDMSLIHRFVTEDPFGVSPEEMAIVRGWKDLTGGRLILFRYLKRHAVFLDERDPPRAYGVVALGGEFEEMLGSRLPIMLNTVLLPLKGRIVYDSLVVAYRVSFGGGFRRTFNDAYREAKARHGVIFSLPFSPEMERTSDADRLRIYLSTERSRAVYREEIEELIRKDSSLLILCHQEMGKRHARRLRKELRARGISQAWFALLEGMIVASGSTREDVERTLGDILPAEKRQLAYVFRMKRR